MKQSTKRILYTLVVTLIIVFSTTFSVLMLLERNDYKNYLQGEYSKNIYELISSVQNIRTNLSKVAIVGSKDQEIIVFEEIFRHAATANDKLHSLPISQNTIGDTSKFLVQVGDFSNNLSKSIVQNKSLSSKDYDNIEKLKNESLRLENQLRNVVMDINEGRIGWGEIRKKVSGVLAREDKNSITNQFQSIQKQVIQYPALIYDGPFSDNVLKINPRINNDKVVNEKEAEKFIRKIIGDKNIEYVKLDTNKKGSRIDSYRFLVSIKGRKGNNSSITAEVSKHGGKLLYMLDQRNIGQPKIKSKQAIEIGNKYLKELGFNNMIPTYNLTYENVMVINYVYKQGDTIIYPDQVKLKIALDNGNIIGVESEKYLISHYNRQLNNVSKISKTEAQKNISKNLQITNVRLAIIPTENDNEVLTYEFSGTYKKDKFKIYINAKTGYEENIIQIIDTPNGELTI